MSHIETQINDAADAIRRRWNVRPRVGIILGTGLATFADQIEREAAIATTTIPHFPASTALGAPRPTGLRHARRRAAWPWKVGFTSTKATARADHAAGARDAGAGRELLIVSNACGGMNPNYALGDIVVIDDHINLMGGNPLVGQRRPARSRGSPT